MITSNSPNFLVFGQILHLLTLVELKYYRNGAVSRLNLLSKYYILFVLKSKVCGAIQNGIIASGPCIDR